MQATAAPTAPAAPTTAPPVTVVPTALAAPAATAPAATKPASGNAATPQDNSVTTTQALNQTGVNVATTTVDPPDSARSSSSANSHPVAQSNTQLAQNVAVVQITGNDDSVTIEQTILQVASNIASAFFGPSANSPTAASVSQSGTNLAQNIAVVVVNGDNQQSTINQTILQGSSNTGTIAQPIAGSGQTTQTNANLASNTAVVVVNGNHDTVKITQTIIQVAENIANTLVPHNGETSAVGAITQSNNQQAANVAAISVSGTGNGVTVNQSITQSASNQNAQLLVNPAVHAPENVAVQAPENVRPGQPPPSLTRVASTLTTSISPGDSVSVGTAVHDTATVTGSAPTGMISFVFFNNGSCTGTGAPAGAVPLAVISPSMAVAASGSVTPTVSGDYAFIASYSGDTANAPATSACEPLKVR